MKSGIDFFPLDVSLDSKFQLIEAEFGLTGFGVIVRLLQKIYGEAGYYIEWTDDVALLFAQKDCGLGGNVVSEIVSASIKRGMFHPGIYDKYHVLTSRGIQKRYFEAVKRRKELTVWGDILLLDSSLLPKNVNIERKNANISSENADNLKQSKVKESKEKKSKAKDSGGADAPAPEDFFTGDLLEAVKTWLDYKAERREKYATVGLNTLFTKIRNSAAKYGEQAMIEVILESVASRYAGILWNRLERPGNRPAATKQFVTAKEYKEAGQKPIDLDTLKKRLDAI